MSDYELQHVKLARKLSKRSNGKTLYLLDKPTTGLHFADIKQLFVILYHFRNQGNIIVVIKHNLDAIKLQTGLSTFGQEGGSSGGYILVSGTPEAVADCQNSYTGRFLYALLKNNSHLSH